ncbi:MAG TPA: hypothetical protein VED46_16410 [Alphaproteobacteria bacterium]|nr:hypothetical protein [Alphaproteobacteria bacterium]
MRLALPLFAALTGLALFLRCLCARPLRHREPRSRAGPSGPADTLPHTDPHKDPVGAASENSFPASDPPSYSGFNRLGRPSR